MSWKGFQKSVARAPMQVRKKVHKGQYMDDAVFQDVKRRFESIEQQTKKLHEESRRYREAIKGMLQHQIEYSQTIEQINGPISGTLSDPETLTPQGNHDGIAACQQYRDLVIELRQLINPELELIESRILKPADEMLSIIHSSKKMLTKREHKQLDVERREIVLRKLEEKQERSAKDEEKLHKAGQELEMAQQEYNQVSGLLKDEMVKLFALEGEFFKPLFQSFYFIQLNIYYTMSSRMEEMKIPYFDMSSSIVAGFHQKRGDIGDKVDQLAITHFRSGHPEEEAGGWKAKLGHHHKVQSPSMSRISSDSISENEEQPPPYPGHPRGPIRRRYLEDSSDDDLSDSMRHESAGETEKPPQMPPRPRPANDAETCTALYDYTAQSPGDLSFREGDTIEIVERTGNMEDWWVGRLGDMEGNFPANYVKL